MILMQSLFVEFTKIYKTIKAYVTLYDDKEKQLHPYTKTVLVVYYGSDKFDISSAYSELLSKYKFVLHLESTFADDRMDNSPDSVYNFVLSYVNQR